MLKAVRQEAARVLERLRALAVEGRPDSPYVKLDKHDHAHGGSIMAVSVERIRPVAPSGAEIWSVAHYFEMNGDLCADPSVEFLRVREDYWYPLTFQQDPAPGYRQYVWVNDDTLAPEKYNRRWQHDLATFCGTWMANVKEQQSLSA